MLERFPIGFTLVRLVSVFESHGLGFPLYGCSIIPMNGAVIVVVGFGRVVANARIVVGVSEFARILHVVRRGHMTSLVRIVEIVRAGDGCGGGMERVRGDVR